MLHSGHTNCACEAQSCALAGAFGPGVSEHIDFVAKNITYEEQLEAAGKAYLDWYMLSQVQGARARKRVEAF